MPSSLTRLDCTVTFGQPGTSETVPITGVSSQTQVGTVTPLVATYNEPTGLNQLMNTGAMNTAPSQVANGTWSSGGPLPVTFTMFSPPGGAVSGSVPPGNAANLILVSSQDSSSTGYRLLYPAALEGGYTPVNFQCNFAYPTVGQPGYWVVSAGTYYWRARMRASSGFTNNGNVATKFWFFHTNGGPSNHFVAGWDANTKSTHLYASLGLQNPTNTYDSESGANGSLGTGGNIDDGNWHTVEWLVLNSWPVGTANGTISVWVDGVKVVNKASQQVWESSDSGLPTSFQWQSTYGGGTNSPPSASPPQPMSWDFDQLYMSAA